MTRFLIIRHGETEWNALGREMGQLDSPLTSLGVEQAERTARRLIADRPTTLYASDLGRAEHTARIIGAACGLAPCLDARLRERHMGIFQGLTVQEGDARYPQERAYRTDDAYVISGGESGRQMADRGLACLEDLAAHHSSETIVVVTHSGMLMRILERTLSLPTGAGRRFCRPNTAINVFTRGPSGWGLESWGDVSHLNKADSLARVPQR